MTPALSDSARPDAENGGESLGRSSEKVRELPDRARNQADSEKVEVVLLGLLKSRQYCGSKVIISNDTNSVSIDNSSQIESNLQQMRQFYNNHDLINALLYANKVIELDPNQFQAWFIRGKCTDNITDKKISFENALKLTDDPDIIKSVKNELNNISAEVNLRVNLVAPDMFAFAINVTVDGNTIPISTSKPVNVPLKKGKHVIKAKISGSVNSSSKTLDLDCDESVTITMKKTLMSAKLIIQ